MGPSVSKLLFRIPVLCHFLRVSPLGFLQRRISNGKVIERSRDFRKILDKSSVIPSKPEKRLELFKITGPWPRLEGFNFGWVCFDPILGYYMA